MKTTAQRRADTAQMTKCECGNVARHGETKCGACLAQAEEDAKPKFTLERLTELLDAYAGPGKYVLETTTAEDEFMEALGRWHDSRVWEANRDHSYD
jgi:hypothetical protein